MAKEIPEKLIKKIEEIVRTGKDIKFQVAELIDSTFNELLTEVATK